MILKVTPKINVFYILLIFIALLNPSKKKKEKIKKNSAHNLLLHGSVIPNHLSSIQRLESLNCTLARAPVLLFSPRKLRKKKAKAEEKGSYKLSLLEWRLPARKFSYVTKAAVDNDKSRAFIYRCVAQRYLHDSFALPEAHKHKHTHKKCEIFFLSNGFLITV